jgi:hypothetical protein
LGEAATRWRERGGGNVWTYTHSWDKIEPEDFGPAISVLASVETPQEVVAATDRGYTPAMTVVAFHSSRAYSVPKTCVKIIPCPAQTRGGVKCINCRLCFKKLPKGKAVSFHLHGCGATKAASRLPILGQITMPWGS